MQSLWSDSDAEAMVTRFAASGGSSASTAARCAASCAAVSCAHAAPIMSIAAPPAKTAARTLAAATLARFHSGVTALGNDCADFNILLTQFASKCRLLGSPSAADEPALPSQTLEKLVNAR